MTSDTRETIGMLGILGSGMRGLAWILASRGNTILGTDAKWSPDTKERDMEKHTFVSEADFIASLPTLDRLIHSDSVPVDHPVLRAAREHNVDIQPYQEALGELSENYTTIAITGTHGKSSTTAFLAHILIEAGADPTVLVGAPVPTWPGLHARVGNSNLFIVEADEYRRHFLTLHPAHSIVTNIDFDHPDYFEDMQDVEDAYAAFLALLPEEGTCTTHQTVRAAHTAIAWPQNTRYLSATDYQDMPAPLPGEHMRQNAALAVQAAGEIAGIDRAVAIKALQSFPGLGRRMELLGSFQGVPVMSDYGHHPEEIRATLAAVRQTYPQEKIAVIFEAHMRERLDSFLEQFKSAFTGAHSVVLYPPFSPTGREGAATDPHIQELSAALQHQGIQTHVVDTPENLLSVLQKQTDIDRIVAFSAGVLDGHLRHLMSNNVDVDSTS